MVKLLTINKLVKMKTLTTHWNEIFKETNEEKLGWYENDFSQTLKFLHLIPEWNNLKMFVAGVGTSGLISMLLKTNIQLVLNDLSPEAIAKAKNKYDDKNQQIKWLRQDISQPLPIELYCIDIWFDRAVLHFLLDDRSVAQYFKNVNSAVKIGGYAIFAEFSTKGALKCAGLQLRRYDVQTLEKNLPAFELIASEEYTYINPNGEPREYIYSLFNRIH